MVRGSIPGFIPVSYPGFIPRFHTLVPYPFLITWFHTPVSYPGFIPSVLGGRNARPNWIPPHPYVLKVNIGKRDVAVSITGFEMALGSK